MPDPTPTPAEARATKATERDAKDFAVEFGGYLANAATDFLDRYVAVPRASNAEDFQRLRSAIYEFRKRAGRIPEAKDGAAPSPETGWRPEYRHKKRSSDYMLVGNAVMQTGAPVNDYDLLVVYRDIKGNTWVRPEDEFFDGRFERLPLAAAPAAPSPDLAALRETIAAASYEFTKDYQRRRGQITPAQLNVPWGLLPKEQQKFGYAQVDWLFTHVRELVAVLKAQPNAGPSANDRET